MSFAMNVFGARDLAYDVLNMADSNNEYDGAVFSIAEKHKEILANTNGNEDEFAKRVGIGFDYFNKNPEIQTVYVTENGIIPINTIEDLHRLTNQ